MDALIEDVLAHAPDAAAARDWDTLKVLLHPYG